MKLKCPNCATAFTVPDRALQPAGRTVRCSRCTHVWFAGPDGAEAPPPLPVAVPSPEPEPAATVPEPPPALPQLPSVVTTRSTEAATPAPAKKAVPARRSRLRAVLGWGALATVIMGLALALYFHEVVAAEMPASRPFYRFTKLMPLNDPAKAGDGDKAMAAAKGLPLDGLRFRTTADPDLAQFQGRDLPPTVVVTVSIVNESWRPRSIRMLRGSTADSKGKVLTTWMPVLPRAWLWPGERTEFKSEVSLTGERPAEIQFNLQPLE